MKKFFPSFRAVLGTLCLMVAVGAAAETKCIYYNGNYCGWMSPSVENATFFQDFRLFETEEGSNVFEGTIYDHTQSGITDQYFRFYYELAPEGSLGQWGLNTICPTTFTNEPLSSKTGEFEAAFAYVPDNNGNGIDPGGGAWCIPSDGKPVKFTVDFNTYTMHATVIGWEEQHVYLVGAPSGWVTPDESNADHYANWELAEDENGNFYGEFDIPAGNAMFRFYTALNGWESNSLGTQVEDSPIDYYFDGSKTTYTLVNGKGSFNFYNWEGGMMCMTVNPDNMTFTLSIPSSSVKGVDAESVDSIFGGNGVAIVNASKAGQLRIYNAVGMQVVNCNIEAGPTELSLPEGLYIANGKKFVVK